MVKHDVFTHDWDEYIIKPEFIPLALDICRQYQLSLGYRFKLHRINPNFIPIKEPWLNNPSADIFDPSILNCITRNSHCFKDAKDPK